MGLTSRLDKLKIIGTGELDTASSNVQNSQQNTDDIDEVDNEGQSILMGIIAQLRPGMDLSKITLPTFILEKKSMLERITNFFQIPDILLEANKTDDELERFILILKWYLASWHIAPKAVKKPLNPVLGEIFTCYWDNLPYNNTAYYISEQTSHHPPKSSYFYLVPESKIRVDGVVIPKSKFLGNSSAAIMEGWGHVTLGDHNDEVYIMNQPNVYCRGILFGKMKMELGDHMYIKCASSGLEADIEFKTKGFISGTYDAIEGKIKDSKTQEELYIISGKWNEEMYIKDVKTGKKKILFDTAKSVTIRPKVRPISEQFDYESQRLWGPTIKALGKRDHTLATEEKFKVENDQRERTKKRLEDGVEFHPKLFRRVSDAETSIADLVYIIYKTFNLSDSADVLTKNVLETAPILPGQEFDDKFHIPAFKKHSSVADSK
ncbi:Oxysterol binding protein-like protein OBPa [Scheffersomyces coipomensis]|uniref:Oxysterol binding protein-like protein OBPa n=1 Tax=Scheffersomyces coipomensis TaxID=1788519 RepID=UPI00315D772E